MTITTARSTRRTAHRDRLRHTGPTRAGMAGSPVTAAMPVTAVPSALAAVPRSLTDTGVLPDGRALASWAARIDADGIGAHEDLADSLVAAASRYGLCPVLVDVLADPNEPSVARERAFGRLALALTRSAA